MNIKLTARTIGKIFNVQVEADTRTGRNYRTKWLFFNLKDGKYKVSLSRRVTFGSLRCPSVSWYILSIDQLIDAPAADGNYSERRSIEDGKLIKRYYKTVFSKSFEHDATEEQVLGVINKYTS